MLMLALMLPLGLMLMLVLVPDCYCHSKDDHENGGRHEIDDGDEGGDSNEHHGLSYGLCAVPLFPSPVRHAYRLAGSSTDGDNDVSRSGACTTLTNRIIWFG